MCTRNDTNVKRMIVITQTGEKFEWGDPEDSEYRWHAEETDDGDCVLFLDHYTQRDKCGNKCTVYADAELGTYPSEEAAAKAMSLIPLDEDRAGKPFYMPSYDFMESL